MKRASSLRFMWPKPMGASVTCPNVSPLACPNHPGDVRGLSQQLPCVITSLS